MSNYQCKHGRILEQHQKCDECIQESLANLGFNQPTTPVQAAGECPTCGGTGLTGVIADDGSGVKEPCPSCRYGFGPEIKSQAAQAEPALPRKAHVSQEAEECKVGAAILADLKVWLEFRLQTVEHQEPDCRPYPPTGHEQDSYSVVPIPEWETRQKLDAITAALLQFSAKDL